MTDNPLRRAMQESADMGARLLRAKNQDISNRLAATPGMNFHLDRAITEAVQENNMGVRTFKMTDYERRVASIADAICTPGKREEENKMTTHNPDAIEIVALTRRQWVQITAALALRVEVDPRLTAAFETLYATTQAWSEAPARFGGTLNTGHPEDQED